MAEDTGSDAEAKAKAKKKGKMKVIIIAAVVLTLLAGGAAAALMMSGGHKKAGRQEKEPEVPSTYAFEDRFMVNIMTNDGGTHFLQIPKMELEIVGKTSASEIDAKKARVMDRINTAMHNELYEDMIKPGGDKKLRNDIKDAVNQALSGNRTVTEVILPQFFIVQ